MGDGPSLQYSPDGQWWWDGSQWRPVPTHHQPAGRAQTYPLAQPTRRSGGFPVWAIVVVIVGGVALGGVGLVVALWATGSTATTPNPVASISPVAPLSTSAIQGVTVGHVRGELKQQGYQCEGPQNSSGTWVTECNLRQGGVFYDVALLGSTATEVDEVQAGLVNDGRVPTQADAGPFYSMLIDTLGHVNGASQAKSWVRRNLAEGGHTTVGDLQLDMGSPSTNTLFIDPK